jgi:uncharacterized membrane protein HdeD (DUF308 family)
MKTKNALMNALIFAIVVIISTVLLYAVFAFANWNCNPGQWSDMARGILAVILGIIYTCCAIAMFIGEES